jgi:pyruvate,water dikinase
MIGFRGCSRYYSESFSQAFGLECQAIKHVRNNMGLVNVAVMLPFCRTVGECQQTLDMMKKLGLEKDQDDLKIFMMTEIPSNFLLAEQFAPYVSGFSIGSNDITQLTLGLDRDNQLISYLFNERDPAVKKLITMACNVANRYGMEIGCCGQGPSDYPDFAQFLVEQNITSISVVPDSLIKTINAIHDVECRLMTE